MPLSMYQASVPVFVRAFRVLSALIEKGAGHAAAEGIDPATLVTARLAPDMLTLAGQVQRASDTAKASAARLTGEAAPSFPDEEASLEDLQSRIAKTIAYLETVRPEAMEASEGREIEMFSGERRRVFRGDDYLLTFAIPNFFFHITTAYDILRHVGVPVGKRDFLGPYEDKR